MFLTRPFLIELVSVGQDETRRSSWAGHGAEQLCTEPEASSTWHVDGRLGAQTHRGQKSAQVPEGTRGVQEKCLRVNVISRGSAGRDQKRPTGTVPGLRLSNEQLAQCSLDPFAERLRRRRAEPAGGTPHSHAENASRGWDNNHVCLQSPASVPYLN